MAAGFERFGRFPRTTEKCRGNSCFIIKTKFDSHLPEIDVSQESAVDEESEERLHREAIERHKRRQTDTYRYMFRNIAAPKLPLGTTPQETAKREEMLDRINSVNVFFVSAAAYEAFEGRFRGTTKVRRRLMDQFSNDPLATGVPALKFFLNGTAEDYLARFYYRDIASRLETEVDRLVRFFRQKSTTVEAELSGGSQAIAELVAQVDESILPWFKDATQAGVTEFSSQARTAASNISANWNR